MTTEPLNNQFEEESAFGTYAVLTIVAISFAL